MYIVLVTSDVIIDNYYVPYTRTFSSKGSADHHPSREECREGRRRTDANHTSQPESFIYLSGSGFRIRLRIPALPYAPR